MEFKVENKNKKYSEIIKKIYCGKFSELESLLFFKYSYYMYKNRDSYFSDNMNKISNDSLSHMDIFGRIISLLGGVPDYRLFNNEDYYVEEKEKLIEIGIRIIKQKIIEYTNCLNSINDSYINDILKSFIIEERKNLEILELLQLKYKREHFK